MVDVRYPPPFISVLCADAHTLKLPPRIIKFPAADSFLRLRRPVRESIQFLNASDLTSQTPYSIVGVARFSFFAEMQGEKSEIATLHTDSGRGMHDRWRRPVGTARYHGICNPHLLRTRGRSSWGAIDGGLGGVMVFEDKVVELQVQRAFDAAAGAPKGDIVDLEGDE